MLAPFGMDTERCTCDRDTSGSVIILAPLAYVSVFISAVIAIMLVFESCILLVIVLVTVSMAMGMRMTQAGMLVGVCMAMLVRMVMHMSGFVRALHVCSPFKPDNARPMLAAQQPVY